MWPFFLERTVTLRKRICGPISKVNEIVQHPESFSRLQPLVTRVDQDPANPQRYKITEHLHAPAHLWEYDNAFHATFTPKEDEDGRGVNVLVELPQSFLVPKFETKVRAKETTESGVVEVSEILQVRVCARQLFSRLSGRTCV